MSAYLDVGVAEDDSDSLKVILREFFHGSAGLAARDSTLGDLGRRCHFAIEMDF